MATVLHAWPFMINIAQSLIFGSEKMGCDALALEWDFYHNPYPYNAKMIYSILKIRSISWILLLFLNWWYLLESDRNKLLSLPPEQGSGTFLIGVIFEMPDEHSVLSVFFITFLSFYPSKMAMNRKYVPEICC